MQPYVKHRCMHTPGIVLLSSGPRVMWIIGSNYLLSSLWVACYSPIQQVCKIICHFWLKVYDLFFSFSLNTIPVDPLHSYQNVPSFSRQLLTVVLSSPTISGILEVKNISFWWKWKVGSTLLCIHSDTKRIAHAQAAHRSYILIAHSTRLKWPFDRTPRRCLTVWPRFDPGRSYPLWVTSLVTDVYCGGGARRWLLRASNILDFVWFLSGRDRF